MKDLLKAIRGANSIPEEILTKPSKWAFGLVCIQDCRICPLATRGCADQCVRFFDKVCKGCPCATHENIKDVRLTFVDPPLDKEKTPIILLDDGDIADIRNKYSSGKYTQAKIASEYRISPSRVSRITNRKTYK